MNEQTVIGLSDPDRKALFLEAHRNTGMGAEMIEKDFWVCWTLRHLFELPEAKDHFIFKGGTSLSKVWRVIQRFSEDIDISLSREWLGFSG
jgi:predicted nucleotidyltransferase component of viral defense system